MTIKGSATKIGHGKVKEEDRPRIEAGDIKKPEPEDFFKTTDEKDPNHHYHWAVNDPRRIHEMKRKGFEIDPSTNSEEARRKAANQREYLKRQMHDPSTSRENAEMAKELLNRMESSPVDTVMNIPGHILMRQPMEKRKQEMQRRLDVSNKMRDKLEADVRDMDKAMQRSGLGGMKAFTEMFDKIKERQGG